MWLGDQSFRDQAISRFITYSRAKTLADAWQTCESGSEMVRLCGAMLGAEGWPTTHQILRVVCECAETTFRYLPENETRPRECVRVPRLWAEGKATIEEVEAAVRAATGSTGPIARTGVVWWNAAMEEVAGLTDAARKVASAAYAIADATLWAADADNFFASGDTGQAWACSYAFWCLANGAISLSEWNTDNAELKRDNAELIRARLHPKRIEAYRRTTPISDAEAYGLAQLKDFTDFQAALLQISESNESEKQFKEALITFTMLLFKDAFIDRNLAPVVKELVTIGEQAAKKPEERSTETVRTILKKIPSGVSTAPEVAARWEKYGPIIEAHFGHL